MISQEFETFQTVFVTILALFPKFSFASETVIEIYFKITVIVD